MRGPLNRGHLKIPMIEETLRAEVAAELSPQGLRGRGQILGSEKRGLEKGGLSISASMFGARPYTFKTAK